MSSIDIAVPCYQYGRFLRGCVESVLTQDVRDVRVVIIDNASTDNTLEIARQLAAEDHRVEILARTKNCGPHASFNAGIDWASSDYFMILCADDLLSPGSLKRAVSIMEQHRELSFAYGEDMHTQDQVPSPPSSEAGENSWRILWGAQFIEDRCRNPEQYLAAGMVLVRTSLQKKAGYYRPELPHTDDFEMLLRLALLGPVAYTPAIQGIKRMHGSNRTNTYLEERTRDLVERVAAIECFFSHEGRAMPLAARLRRLGRRSIAERAYWCGLKDLARGRRSAFALLRLAFELDRTTVVVPPVNYLFRTKRFARAPLQAAGAATSSIATIQN
jgi:glycosyltransferase involved in cell wall biosynthesis